LKGLSAQLETAAGLYEKACRSSAPLDRVLSNFFHEQRRRFGSKERRLISDCVFGMFRHKLLIEDWIRELEPDGPFFRAASALACEGMINAEGFRNFIEPSCAERLYRALTAREPASVFGADQTAEKFSLKYSFPLWLVRNWMNRFGESETGELLGSLNERAPFVLRANPLKAGRREVMEILLRQGHEVSATELSPLGIRAGKRFNVFESPEFKEGFFEIQDEGSQMIVLEAGPRPGEIFWDACAGGGGKTLLAAALMKNSGRVIASDIRTGKLEELRERAKRAGAFNIVSGSVRELEKKKMLSAGVDRLLIDAPCSGTGTLRRNPDQKWRLTEEIIVQFRENQLKILEDYSPHLKRGGVLIYATCSLQAEENEEVIGSFLERHPDFGREGGDKRFFPHRDGTDGFFVAKLLKRP